MKMNKFYLDTPMGTLFVENEFHTIAEARDAGFEFFFLYEKIHFMIKTNYETNIPEYAVANYYENIKIHNHSDEIQVAGHHGTWYVKDNVTIDSVKYFLLEHEDYGDETACLIVDINCKLILDEVFNGFDDLFEYLDSEKD